MNHMIGIPLKSVLDVRDAERRSIVSLKSTSKNSTVLENISTQTVT